MLDGLFALPNALARARAATALLAELERARLTVAAGGAHGGRRDRPELA